MAKVLLVSTTYVSTAVNLLTDELVEFGIETTKIIETGKMETVFRILGETIHTYKVCILCFYPNATHYDYVKSRLNCPVLGYHPSIQYSHTTNQSLFSDKTELADFVARMLSPFFAEVRENYMEWKKDQQQSDDSEYYSD